MLFYTDGLVEEHTRGGEQFGEVRLVEAVERVTRATGSVQEMVRGLSHALMRERAGITSDDATLFLVEWRGAGARG